MNQENKLSKIREDLEKHKKNVTHLEKLNSEIGVNLE